MERRPSHVSRIVAVTGADDDEAASIVEKIKAAAVARGRPITNLGGYIASMPDEHLHEHLDELRTAREQEQALVDRQGETAEQRHARIAARRAEWEARSATAAVVDDERRARNRALMAAARAQEAAA